VLAAAARQAQSLQATAHRPWPLPARPWLAAATLTDQLFAHWPVPAATLQRHLPDGVSADTFEGDAWLGVTAFAVGAQRLRGTLPLPIVSRFLQLNVRACVSVQGTPGVWFFSIDVSSAPILRLARRLFPVAVFHARVTARRLGDEFRLECTRRDHPEPPKVFDARFTPTGTPRQPQPGSLEHFLTERYRVYLSVDGRLRRAEIHHAPWQLREAAGEVELNTMAPAGVALAEQPILHFSRSQDVLLWSPEPVSA
jgi:uncharacterized protein YqjF (DUF2071 family)